MINRYYILDGKKPVSMGSCENKDSLMEWAEFMENGNRVVKKDKACFNKSGGIDVVEVSTVFLGLDHSFGDEVYPVLFETMVFGGEIDGEMWRCSTWEEAERIHEEVKEKVSNAYGSKDMAWE